MNPLRKFTFAANILGLLGGLTLIVGCIRLLSKPSEPIFTEKEAKIAAYVSSFDAKLGEVIKEGQNASRANFKALKSAHSSLFTLGFGLTLISAVNLLANSVKWCQGQTS